MWEAELPGTDDQLRQGDLLLGVPFPRPSAVTLTEAGLVAGVRPSRAVVVIDQCCAVSQKGSVTLADVGRTGQLVEGSPNWEALHAVKPTAGQRFSKYEHLLGGHPSLDAAAGTGRIINLLSRVTLAPTEQQFAELRTRRVARMTPLARAHLRLKLAVFYGGPEEDDEAWLAEHGYDARGLPLAP